MKTTEETVQQRETKIIVDQFEVYKEKVDNANKAYNTAWDEFEAAKEAKVGALACGAKFELLQLEAEGDLANVVKKKPDPDAMQRLYSGYLRFIATEAGRRYTKDSRRVDQVDRDTRVSRFQLMDYTMTHARILTREVKWVRKWATRANFWNELGSACYSLMHRLNPKVKGQALYHYLLVHKRIELLRTEEILPENILDESHQPTAEEIVYVVSRTGRHLIQMIKRIQAITAARPDDDIENGPSDYLHLPHDIPFEKKENGDKGARYVPAPEYAKAITTVAYNYPFLLGRNSQHQAPTQYSLAASLSKRRRAIYGFA